MRDQVRAGVIVLGAIVAAIFSAIPVINHLRGGNNKDYPLWYAVGVAVWQGEELYPCDPNASFPFMYPPPAATMLATAASAGPLVMIIGFTVATTLAWGVVVALSITLTGGRPGPIADPLLLVVPSLVCCVYLHNMYLLGQPNLMLLALLLGAFACLRVGWEWRAGALVALAAAIKAFPILAAGYFVYRRRWAAVASTVVCLTGLMVLLPAPTRGFARNRDELAIWARGMLFQNDANGVGQRPGLTFNWRNQSLIGVGHRLLRPIDADFQRAPDGSLRPPTLVNLAALDFRPAQYAVSGAMLVMGLAFVACMPSRRDRTSETDAVEFAAVVMLILLCTPYAFLYYFVWLIYPLTVVMRPAFTAPTRGERWATGAWVAACVGLLISNVFDPTRTTLLAYGNHFWACVLLYAGLLVRLRRLGAAARDQAAEPLTASPTARAA